MLQRLKNSANYISGFFNNESYSIGIILGSGLGELGKSINVKHILPYSDIPHFPVSTVEGHEGNLIIGEFGGKNVIAMQGRFHYYEGYTMQNVTFPVRVMKFLGIETLFVSNAAGGVNTSYLVGDLMVITDHINLFPEHPLRGKNNNELGPRFPGMTDAYDPDIIRLAEQCAEKLGIQIRKGVYAGLQGPSFETPAEYNWIRVIGGDAVGMSTVPEVIVARHMGIRCFGMSVITNSTASAELIKTNHEEVQDVGNSAQPQMTSLFREIIRGL
ncbi:purine-nucleoside phosphorylase [Odoribacter sp. OttesenSCG-928-J03]|nr:purine-nucleoside phosphorylase [Odoribacter sp. OttesenSCG-928-J03]MDL2283350.1 purine-nucleoside phosphorylase [Odoribacter sp. OttesenSCG-928-G04]MDL2331330.1 purine-nucleoside phosphorylase [Odoribacter sp. OttesenSCG-928-A06]